MAQQCDRQQVTGLVDGCNLDIYTETGSGSALSDNSDIPPSMLAQCSVHCTLQKLADLEKSLKDLSFFVFLGLLEVFKENLDLIFSLKIGQKP